MSPLRLPVPPSRPGGGNSKYLTGFAPDATRIPRGIPRSPCDNEGNRDDHRLLCSCSRAGCGNSGVAGQHSITPDEYDRILKALGRVPSLTELGIYSVMWSEHCSYKSSRVHLKRLPTKSDRVVQGPGENAGIIDVGDGWACAFKIESHNHPSYIEPFQGAATGVGGILRDIFTMGARPLAVMDSLRFGPIAPEPGEPSRNWSPKITPSLKA